MAKANRPASMEPSETKPKWIQITVVVIALVAIVGGYFAWNGSSKSDTQGTESLRDTSSLPGRLVLPASARNPRPQTLAPEQFSEKETRDAYQAAKDVPEVLEHLPCYCGCFASAAHRSNLECFKDNHGTECSLCRSIALEGKKMHDEGHSLEEIQRDINTRWAPLLK